MRVGVRTIQNNSAGLLGKEQKRLPWALERTSAACTNYARAAEQLRHWPLQYAGLGDSFPTEILAMRTLIALMVGCSSLLLSFDFAAAQETKGAVKPLKVLLVTGGCCHDYDRQKLILSEGIGYLAKTEFTIVQEGGKSTNHKISIYEKDDWADAYDVVIHNECFSDVKEPAFTERILKPHREGKPAIVIHCAMHCYRDKTDEWFKFIGVTSHKHGGHFAFDVTNVQPDNPIMKNFGEKWKTPQGELYHIEKTWENCTPLAKGYSPETKSDHVCIWTNTYGKGRVFGTTVGHYSTEMQDPIFLNYVTRGLLWSCDKLNDDYLIKREGKIPFSFESKPGDPEPTPAKK